MKLEIAKIRLDGGTQPRAALNREVIADYCERMQEGVVFRPVIVYFDGESYWLADGFHRVEAAKQAEQLEIEAEIIQGTQSDAQWHSYSVNKEHGLRRTNEDKDRAVKAALMHPKSQELSDAAIAVHVGVHRNTVLKIRRLTTPEKNDLHNLCKSTPRTGRDGRTINTAKIGKATSFKPARPRSPTEIRDARKAGRKVRPVCLVKLQLPNNHVQNCAFDLLRHFTFEYLEKVFAHVVKLHQTLKAKETQS